MFTKSRVLNSKAAQAVEFTILLPVVLSFLFGIIEYGWAMTSWIVITNAASHGARAAIVGMDAETAAKEPLWEIMKDDDPAGELCVERTVINEGDPSNEYPKRVKVKVVWKFQRLIGFLPSDLVPREIASESVMAVL